MVGSVSASFSADYARAFSVSANAARVDSPEIQQERNLASSRPNAETARAEGGASKDALSASSKVAETGKRKDPNELTEEEQKQVDKLKARDAEVRAHEEAHAAVGGSLAGSPSYEFQTGPDGKQYAIGGEVQIDTAPVAGDPEATVRKMDVVIAAALAPAEPSAQDQAVARQAQATRSQAQAEATAKRQKELTGESDENSEDDASPSSSLSQQASDAYRKTEEAVVSQIFQAEVSTGRSA